MWSGGLNKDNCFQEEVFSGFQRTELWDLWFPKRLQCLVLNFCLTFFNYYIKSAGAKCKFWISALSKWEFHSCTHWESSVKNLWCRISLSAASFRSPIQLGQLQGGVHEVAVMCHFCTWASSWSHSKAKCIWMKPARFSGILGTGRTDAELWGKKAQICFKVRFLLKSRCFLLHLLKNLLSGG